MSERRQQDTLPQEEYEKYRGENADCKYTWMDVETCEHGVHIDSGHTCWECLVNDGDAEIYEGESDDE